MLLRLSGMEYWGGFPVQPAETSGEILADLAFMETLRRMKARFQLELLAASQSEDAAVALSLVMVAVSLTVLVLLRERWWKAL